MLGQVLNLARKEFIQIWRDRVLMVFLVLGPVLQFMLLAQATGSDIQHLPLAVVDQDKSSLSRQIVAVLDNTTYLDLRYYPESSDALVLLMRQGHVRAGVVIPPHFAASLGAGRPASLQLLADGSSYLEASTAIRVAQGALAELVLRNADRSLPGIDLRSQMEFNPQLNIQYHTMPAQFSLIVLEISLLVAALSIARERELGTLEQLRMTPIGQAELLIGKAVLGFAIGMVNFVLVFALCMLAFKLPMRGSLADLVILTVLFVAANLALGLAISALCSSQQQALLLVFLICVLQVNVSGYLLSVNNMPAALQTVAEFSSLRHYLSGAREIMVKGTTLAMLAPHALSLALQTLGGGAIAWGVLSRRSE